VRAEFRDVQDIVIDLSEGFLGNTIICLSIRSESRRRDGQTTEEPCLELHFTRHYYDREHRRYDLRASRLFTFMDATFAESPFPGG